MTVLGQPLKFWRSVEERERGDVGHDEASHPLQSPELYANRRDFLRAAGFTIASAAASACSRAPIEKAIPLLVQPEGQVPGRSSFFTSVCTECAAGCGTVIKAHDGRPIKVEGNPVHPISRGGLCAVGQASLLGLYDSLRFTGPLKQGQPATWKDVDGAIAGELEAIRKSGGAVRVLTGAVLSPTLRAAIDRFVRTFPDARHVTYDSLSSASLLDAHERTHGVRVAPHIRLERADAIASFDADFLGTWIAPVPFSAGYRDARSLDEQPRRFSYHAQFESRMSLTGTRADERIRLAPHEMAGTLAALVTRLSALAGAHVDVSAPPLSGELAQVVEGLADKLLRAHGKSVVLCGLQDVDAQILCNRANEILGAYGTVLDLERPSYQVQGSDRELEDLLRDVEAEKIAALFVLGVNPAYELPLTSKGAAALGRVPLLVSLAARKDETAALAGYTCPVSHPLESWGDAEPVAGVVSVQQPTISPIGKTRSAAESFSAWEGGNLSAYELVRAHWETVIFPRQSGAATFADFWDHALRQGFVEVGVDPIRVQSSTAAPMRVTEGRARPTGALALVLYPKIGMLDGRHAYNAWLQELPDPVTKVTWDNYACFSAATARRLGIGMGDVVRLDVEGAGAPVELPAFIQPGQHDDVVAVPLGYGSALSARFAGVGPNWISARPTVGPHGLVGINMAPLMALAGGVLARSGRTVRVSRTGRVYDLASTQTHFSLTVAEHHGLRATEETAAIRETTLTVLNTHHGVSERPPTPETDLWPDDHQYSGHRWGMVVDLASCTGCSACVVACQAENNSPVVGKDEVRRSREMHWLRIDRYYTGEEDDVAVAVQPMLCQHCENAPCETVCPVAATVHDEEGLNVQVYNRCVGTRFCENNCPYKVRRFNWFEYGRDDRLQNLALNPDVTVRSRGVMEKCTFCFQRIQEAELEAKRLGEPLADGDVRTACQQSCPSRAIVFGDMNDPKSHVSTLRANQRHYHVLEELNVKPSVGYLQMVRNREGI